MITTHPFRWKILFKKSSTWNKSSIFKFVGFEPHKISSILVYVLNRDFLFSFIPTRTEAFTLAIKPWRQNKFNEKPKPQSQN